MKIHDDALTVDLASTSSDRPLEFINITQPKNQYYREYRVVNSWILRKTNAPEDMIHITVPETQTLVERKDGISKYTAFNLHINGWYHAAARYSVLHQFAEAIKQRFGDRFRGPEFPPKKLFRNLDDRALDDRRLKLTKYFQYLVQRPEIARHRFVEKTFLDMQIESYRPTSTCVSIDVYLADGEKINVKCNVTHSTNEVLQILSERLGCESERLNALFGLFVGAQREREKIAVVGDNAYEFDLMSVRLLRNFESPYISLQLMNQRSAARGVQHRITLRKLVWEPRIEEALLDDPVLARLLFAQARADFHNGRLNLCSRETVETLQLLDNQDRAAQFVRTCHLIPAYGYEILAPCRSDYPSEDTRVNVQVGRRQLVLTFPDKGDDQAVFRATRIRVWRISAPPRPGDPLIFQFEYLLNKDSFQWITLFTDQAILLSLLLQSIGAEILHEYRSLPLESQLSLQNGNGSANAASLNTSDSSSTESEEARSSRPMFTNLSDHTADPLGVTDGSYQSFCEMFTLITDVPAINGVGHTITDDDL